MTELEKKIAAVREKESYRKGGEDAHRELINELLEFASNSFTTKEGIIDKLWELKI